MGRIPGKTVRPLGEIRVVLPRRFFDVLFDGTTWPRTDVHFEFQFTNGGMVFRMILEGEVHGFVIGRYKYHEKIRIYSLDHGTVVEPSVFVKSWTEAAKTVRNMIQAKRAATLFATGEKAEKGDT